MKEGILALAFILFLSFSSPFVYANDLMEIEVDVLADEVSDSEISIEVPESFDIGEIEEGGVTDKFQIYINNTGNIDVVITPELVTPYNSIFDYIYFQDRKTGNRSLEYQIGDYSFIITKPASSGVRSEYFWIWMDLSDYSSDIEDDLTNEKADIKFIALPSV